MAYAFTEPGVTRRKGISTTAKKDGDYYILNGTKCFITNARYADKYTILATHDPVKAIALSRFLW